MKQTPVKPMALLGLLILFISCSNDDPAEMEALATNTAFQELFDQGIDRYLGVFSPATSEEIGGGQILHTFQGMEGPICFTGNEFTMTTRDGSSDKLMIFLQGGGVCGPIACDAVDTATSIPTFGILNPSPDNPTANYDVGYIPYCDGTFFTGDAEVDSDGDGQIDRHHRGIQNLSAALDVIARRYPNPSLIFLTGNSAGGFGVHFALPLVRKLYPNVRIELINDSGVGIMPPGLISSFLSAWNATSFLPASCPTCIGADGNLTDYHAYQLAQDANIRLAFISSTQDSVAAGAFAGDGAVFEEELLNAISELSTAYPERFQSMIADDDTHTFIIRQFTRDVGGRTVQQWITDMLRGSENWTSVSDLE